MVPVDSGGIRCGQFSMVMAPSQSTAMSGGAVATCYCWNIDPHYYANLVGRR